MLMPSRGDIWMVSLNPVKGHEQAGIRPALIISVNQFNYGPAGLVVLLPITSRSRNIPLHVEIIPPEGGLKEESFIKCENIRSVSSQRLLECLGIVSANTMEAVEDRIRILLDI